MRTILAFLALVQPASAWDFSPVPVCTLRHEGAEGAVTVTWDPRREEAYAITVMRNAPWPGGPVFAIGFEGRRGLTISTRRHVMSGDGTAVTVTDRGFGNVLDGLEFNDRALADLGGSQVVFSLESAAGPVRAFRACTGATVAARPAAEPAGPSVASPAGNTRQTTGGASPLGSPGARIVG